MTTNPRMSISSESKLDSSVHHLDHLNSSDLIEQKLSSVDLDFGFDCCKRLDNLEEAEAAASAALQTLVAAVNHSGIDYPDFYFGFHDGS